MQYVTKLLKPYVKRLIFVALADALGMIMALLMPYLMSEIVDNGIAVGDYDRVLYSAALMTVISVVSLLGTLLANKLNVAVTVGYTRDLCRTTYEKINSLSTESYRKLGPSNILSRATEDIWNLEGGVGGLVYTAITVPIMLVGSAVLSFMANPTLAVIFVCCIPPTVLIVVRLAKPLYGLWDNADKYTDLQNRIVRERLAGIRVVRAFNADYREHERAKRATVDMADNIIKANVAGNYIEPVALLLLNIATVIMVAVAGGMADSGRLSNAGDIIALVQYVVILSSALISLTWTLSWLPRLRVSINRIGEIHALESEPTSVEDEEQPNGFRIVGENVSFQYPDAVEPAVKDVSFEINEGERVAIIGGTGSAKTTLAKVILGLSNPSSGKISIGGVDYSRIPLPSLRSRFSVALQNSMIFEGTVRDNVLMGKPDATDEEIRAALRDCEIISFVDEQKEGLNYLLVGMGRNVSGGQKQRLSLARAIIRSAEVYLFDDSFSALDYLTESRIRQSLNKRLKGKTVITVTQRVSCAMHADKIFVIDGGRIVSVGTHSELRKDSAIYRDICRSQLGEEEICR